jgi:hypothetical protein
MIGTFTVEDVKLLVWRKLSSGVLAFTANVKTSICVAALDDFVVGIWQNDNRYKPKILSRNIIQRVSPI